MKRSWIVLPLLGIMAFVLSGFGCMGAQQAYEVTESQQGTSWWIIVVYMTIFILAIIAIPLFINGLTRANRYINVMEKNGRDTSDIRGARTRLIIFFVLTLVTAFINFIFFILLAITRTQIIRKWQELPDDIAAKEYHDANTGISQNANYHSAAPSNADELAKYKALLDNGAITQKEYEEVKRKLLNV